MESTIEMRILYWFDIVVSGMIAAIMLSTIGMKIQYYVFDMYLSWPFNNQWLVIGVIIYLGVRLLWYAIDKILGEVEWQEERQSSRRRKRTLSEDLEEPTPKPSYETRTGTR
jgi:uncharacterized membrane protein